MRNDYFIMPHMYYTGPSRNSFYNLEQELAQQRAYEEEMSERRYQERLYYDLMRQRAQQHAIEKEKQRRRLAEERRRERAAREQALRMILFKERQEEEARKCQQQDIMMLREPRMKSKSEDARPRIFQGSDGRIYREVFADHEIDQRMALDSDDEDYDNLPQLNFQPRHNKLLQKRKSQKKKADAHVMFGVVRAKQPKVVVIPKEIAKPTVVVEDASDSECEDEFKSYIRNRRPRDGEWMEPVEACQRNMQKGRLHTA